MMQCMNYLNLKLQGRGKHTADLLSFLESFQTILRLWKSEMRKRNVIHFLTLKNQGFLKRNM